MRRGALIPLGIIIAVVIGLYFSGHLDRPLYSIGLNYHACGRNGLGVTFCGQELEERQAAQQTTESEAKETASHVAQEGREAQAQIQRLAKDSQEAEARQAGRRKIEELETEAVDEHNEAQAQRLSEQAEQAELEARRANEGP